MEDEDYVKCGECGMLVRPTAFHPYAACVMYRQSGQAEKVEDWLGSVIAYGMNAGEAGLSVGEALADIGKCRRRKEVPAERQRLSDEDLNAMEERAAGLRFLGIARDVVPALMAEVRRLRGETSELFDAEDTNAILANILRRGGAEKWARLAGSILDRVPKEVRDKAIAEVRSREEFATISEGIQADARFGGLRSYVAVPGEEGTREKGTD